VRQLSPASLSGGICRRRGDLRRRQPGGSPDPVSKFRMNHHCFRSVQFAISRSFLSSIVLASLLICFRFASAETPANTARSGAAAAKPADSSAIAYTDLKNHKVSLPYGAPFVVSGDIAEVQLTGGALAALIAPQTVAGDYTASDGVKGDITPSPITGTTWKVTIGKLNADTSVTINFQFTGALSPAVQQAVFDEMLNDPAYKAATSQFITSALGKTAAAQMSAATLLSQTAAAVVTSVLNKKGLTPKNPADLKTALGTALLNNIEPIFNLNGQIASLQIAAYRVADLVGLPTAEFNTLSAQQLAEKLKGISDYSKLQADLQDGVKTAVDRFLQTYQNAVAGLDGGLKNALFTGSSSLAVGNDQQSDMVSDLKKYAGFDVGALYAYRLSELRSFAIVHIYLGPVQLKTDAPAPKPGVGEWLRQRTSLAFGMALKDLSGSTQSKISGQNAFVYGVGIRLNKYFRLTAGGMLYRTSLPAANGSTSPANGSLRHEFFIGPSIDVTALPALQSIFAKSKSQ